MSPSMKEIYEEASKGNPLLVTREHSRWLEMPEDDRFGLINEERELLQPVIDKLIFGKAKVPRVGRISASGLGMCPRRQLFGFAGAPAIGEDPDSGDLMSMGTHDHLWWQIEGIVMGWLTDVEPFAGYDPRSGIDPLEGGLVGGSIDGVGNEVPLFELKTVISQKYTRIVQVDDTPAIENLLQFDWYADELGTDVGSMVYQERGGGSYHEYWVERTPEIARKREDIVERLGNSIADDTLPPMLEDCEQRQGTVFRNCPFRKYCPKAHTVTVGTGE